jgi:hypothetical protein
MVNPQITAWHPTICSMGCAREPPLAGRHRLATSRKREGVPPHYRQFGDRKTDGTDPVAFVIRENVDKHRHLTYAGRAEAASKLANLAYGGDRKSQNFKGSSDLSITKAQAAKIMGVSEPAIGRARTIERHPDLKRR